MLWIYRSIQRRDTFALKDEASFSLVHRQSAMERLTLVSVCKIFASNALSVPLSIVAWTWQCIQCSRVASEIWLRARVHRPVLEVMRVSVRPCLGGYAQHSLSAVGLQNFAVLYHSDHLLHSPFCSLVGTTPGRSIVHFRKHSSMFRFPAALRKRVQIAGSKTGKANIP